MTMNGMGKNRKGATSPSVIAVLATLSTLTGYLTRVNISVALPFISKDYGWTSHETALNGSLLLGMFLVGYGLSNIFIAPLIDKYGPRRGLMAIMLTWSVITFLTPLAGFIYWLFVISRVVLGLSEGPLFPSASKLTQAWFGPRGRTAVNSFYFSSLYLSNLLVSIALVPLIMLTSGTGRSIRSGWLASWWSRRYTSCCRILHRAPLRRTRGGRPLESSCEIQSTSSGRP